MSNWIPPLSSPKNEKLLEGLSEEEKSEIRRFASFLKWRKEKKEGKEPSISPEMRDWLLGKS